jgi:ABC-type enterochelin transport system permease subunit
LLIAFAGLLVAALTDGSAHDYAHAAFYAAFAAWGWEEVTSGANVVRRAVGVVGFVYVVVKVGQALGA